MKVAGHFFGHRQVRAKVRRAEGDSSMHLTLGYAAILTQDKVLPNGGELLKFMLY